MGRLNLSWVRHLRWLRGCPPSFEPLAGRRRSLTTPNRRVERLGPKVVAHHFGPRSPRQRGSNSYWGNCAAPPANVPWSMRIPTPIVLETETFFR
jgi:hypothetical protein